MNNRFTFSSVSTFVILGFLLASVYATPLSAVVIDRYLTIQPIQVCDDAGSNCAGINLFSAATTKIYEQAGIAPVFLPITQLPDATFLSVGSTGEIDQPGNGQSSNPNTINMWFVEDITSGAFGAAPSPGHRVIINDSILDFHGGVGRIDTIAHEVGHNLGLGHNNFGAGGNNNLMTSGATRNVPGGVGDINPDGAQLDRLTMDQIDEIRTSTLLNPIPEITVDTVGSTPFDSNDFFHVDFASGPANIFLEELTLDLSPVNAFFDPTSAAPPGRAGTPFRLSNLLGINAGDIVVGGVGDGSQLLTLAFADSTFGLGDSFSFGIDIDLFTNIDGFGATPTELFGAIFSFEFSDGYAVAADLDDDIASSILPSQINAFVGQPSGGPVLPQPGPDFIEVIDAQIDIKPGSFPNSVNLKSKGVLSFAILGTDVFNVNEVDINSLLFGDPLLIDNGGTALSPLLSALEDVSGDGFFDLSLKFSVADLVENGALGPDTIEGLLRGKLLDGTPFEGMDSIRIVPPKWSNGNNAIAANTPEPSTALLGALASVGVMIWRRRLG